MRHENPILQLESIPRSTRYYWEKKLDRLYSLCVWAAWKKAKLAKSEEIPTLDAVWGTTGFSAHVFRDTRTNEIIVSRTHPGGRFEHYASVNPTTKEGTQRLLSGINLTGMSIEIVLRAKLGEDDRRQILKLLPVAGKYQGAFWSDPEVHGVLSDETSLRNLERVHRNETEEIVSRLAAAVLQSSAIRKGVKALDSQAAVIPKEHRDQLEILL